MKESSVSWAFNIIFMLVYCGLYTMTIDVVIVVSWVRCIYMQECSVHWLLCLLFSWVQCQSLKPVLSQCCRTGFVTVDYFIALYTRSYIFYSHGCNVFIHARTFFTLPDMIIPIVGTNFSRDIRSLACASRAVVTNNSTMIIEVVLIEGFLYLKSSKACALVRMHVLTKTKDNSRAHSTVINISNYLSHWLYFIEYISN